MILTRHGYIEFVEAKDIVDDSRPVVVLFSDGHRYKIDSMQVASPGILRMIGIRTDIPLPIDNSVRPSPRNHRLSHSWNKLRASMRVPFTEAIPVIRPEETP